MTEKQIYDRLNRCYMKYFIGLDKDLREKDEWFGTDEVTVWHWRRPDRNTEYRLTLNVQTKEITDERRVTGGQWCVVGVYSTEQYFVPFPGEVAFRESEDYPYRK